MLVKIKKTVKISSFRLKYWIFKKRRVENVAKRDHPLQSFQISKRTQLASLAAFQHNTFIV